MATVSPSPSHSFPPRQWTVQDGKNGKRFRVCRMMPTDWDACIEMAAEAFLTRNKIVMALNVPPEDFRKHVAARGRGWRLNGSIGRVVPRPRSFRSSDAGTADTR